MQDLFPASKVLHALSGSDDWQKRRRNGTLKLAGCLGDREWKTGQEDQCDTY